MISCEAFQTRFPAVIGTSTDDAALLAHLRTCDRCLDFASTIDPDVMFRALGGDEIVPPGGVDAFVSGVMQQVRGAQTAVAARHVTSWPRRLAVAATLAVTVSAAMLMQSSHSGAPANPNFAALRPRPVISAALPVALTTKPVIETYESDHATIVEVPNDSADDVKMVMIFDENLPADL